MVTKYLPCVPLSESELPRPAEVDGFPHTSIPKLHNNGSVHSATPSEIMVTSVATERRSHPLFVVAIFALSLFEYLKRKTKRYWHATWHPQGQVALPECIVCLSFRLMYGFLTRRDLLTLKHSHGNRRHGHNFSGTVEIHRAEPCNQNIVLESPI